MLTKDLVLLAQSIELDDEFFKAMKQRLNAIEEEYQRKAKAERPTKEFYDREYNI